MSCAFCVRNEHDGVEGQYLWLTDEPDANEVIAACPADLSTFDEVVFCGFGEPTYRLNVLLEVAKYFKAKGKTVRLNTNGHGEIINNKPVSDLLYGIIDIVSVSLNASTPEGYDALCRPSFENAFEAMLSFALSCKEMEIETVMTVVDTIGEEEIAACQALCDGLDLRLRVRKFF